MLSLAEKQQNEKKAQVDPSFTNRHETNLSSFTR